MLVDEKIHTLICQKLQQLGRQPGAPSPPPQYRDAHDAMCPLLLVFVESQIGATDPQNQGNESLVFGNHPFIAFGSFEPELTPVSCALCIASQGFRRMVTPPCHPRSCGLFHGIGLRRRVWGELKGGSVSTGAEDRCELPRHWSQSSIMKDNILIDFTWILPSNKVVSNTHKLF